MKKSFYLVLVMLLGFSFTAHSQIKFGIKGGLNVTKVSFSNLPSNFDSNNRVGFFAGPTLDVKLPLVGLGVDGAFLFSKRDAKVEYNGKNETFSETGFDIPINLKYTFGLSSLASFYLAAGPNFFFNIDKSQKVDDVKFNKKSAQVGINMGGGVTFLTHYRLGINYNIPLNKSADGVTISDAKETLEENFKDASYKSKNWQISFTYLF
ncbi:hypothetical protein Bcop_0398 [Bacteroides coprosuis DSM 18011]|uniref:Outer membrane protein beta-barrel domain-containing protein n=1 Tax=Bacteroides coprosuis DSM 18011 TaxID=679937 RepID=F3ZQV8_9BACE|nr:outer membrane beta-barrel protein [Bacteroides coprosuis]EGJ70616.1 hypothetical protein Bcop_0398 [Bacteroides coprosuis DSM 18011]